MGVCLQLHILYSPFIITWNTLQRHNTKNLKQKFPEKELRGQFPHSCVRERFIPSRDRSTYIILLQENMWIDPRNI